MKKKYIFILLGLLLFFLLATSQDNNQDDEISLQVTNSKTKSVFSNEQKVNIIGYDEDAMEPYLSRDEKYLFFNDHEGKNNKELYYAEKIDNLTFQYKGEVKGVNSKYVDGNPTMDLNNNFYFITTRGVDLGDFDSIYTGVFEDGVVEDVRKIKGTINIDEKLWINMGVEITSDGNTMYASSARFEVGNTFPSEGNIRFAIREGDEFNIPKNEGEILKNINTNDAIEYAGEVSEDGLELFYSQVILSKPPKFKLYVSKRANKNEPFGLPILINEPFKGNENAFVEGPALSIDANRLYYHKLDKGKFSIFMLSRD